jgi:hypothetical protein
MSANEVPLPIIGQTTTPNQSAVEVPPIPPAHLPTAIPQQIEQLQPVLLTQESTSLRLPSNHSNTNEETVEDDMFVPVYHEEHKYYVLKQYCKPASVVNPTFCRFQNRFCVVLRTKILISGEKLDTNSETVYTPDPTEKKQMTYKKVDAQMMKCLLPSCVDASTKDPKTFHFCCYAHDVFMKLGEGLIMAQCEGRDDVLLTLLRNTEANTKEAIINFSKRDGQLVFPFCTKRCFNSLVTLREKNKKKKTTPSRSNISKETKKGIMDSSCPPANWDRDGGEGKKSSINVLVDWLTTEENLTDYFGGLDTEGNTNGNRKNTYHNLISKLIKEQNGKFNDLKH